MGANIENSNRKGSVDVHLNIVPFIDLMSCLTAFLLVTAVWSNTARVDVRTQQIGKHDAVAKEDEPVQVSVHVTENEIWVGLSRINSFTRVERAGDSYDWDVLHSVLEEHKKSSYFADRNDIEIAVENSVPYQTMVSAMDTALAAGFADVGVLDPGSLSARVRL